MLCNLYDLARELEHALDGEDTHWIAATFDCYLERLDCDQLDRGRGYGPKGHRRKVAISVWDHYNRNKNGENRCIIVSMYRDKLSVRECGGSFLEATLGKTHHTSGTVKLCGASGKWFITAWI